MCGECVEACPRKILGLRLRYLGGRAPEEDIEPLEEARRGAS
jgi:ferredoxin